MSQNDNKQDPHPDDGQALDLSDQEQLALALFQALNEADQRHMIRCMSALLATSG